MDWLHTVETSGKIEILFTNGTMCSQVARRPLLRLSDKFPIPPAQANLPAHFAYYRVRILVDFKYLITDLMICSFFKQEMACK